MRRLSHANGLSTAGQDLNPVMRTFTTLPQGVDSQGTSQDVYYPFRPTISYFEADIATTININGEGEVPLKSDGLGGFILTLEEHMTTPKTIVIADICNWECTFLF